MAKPIQLIVACAENRVIGRGGELPFTIPEDQEWFHQQTANQVVVLGRISFASWPRAVLDGRRPVVVTRDRSLASPRVQVAPDVPAALAIAQELSGGIFICGGQRIYEETLPLADRLILTLVHVHVDGDTYFPDWRQQSWNEVWKRDSADANFRYTFSILERAR